MAKKVRKPRSASPRTYSQSGPQPDQPQPSVEAVAAPRPAARPAGAAPAQPVPRSAKRVDLQAEYPFVAKDLRRLLFTAAAMFGVLVVLNLLLNFVF